MKHDEDKAWQRHLRETEVERLRWERGERKVSGGDSAPGETWVNSIGMEFVLIPAGSFQMRTGGDWKRTEDGWKFHDQPPRNVSITRPFYLGRYPVTQAQWEAVMRSNPSYFKGADRPVESVSWRDTQEFIERLNAKDAYYRDAWKEGWALPFALGGGVGVCGACGREGL